MGMWILESKALEHVPGTTRYFDDLERLQEAASDSTGLKYATTGDGLRIILVPQPSDDPNDPLNWPLWKRDVIILVLSISTIFALSLGPILAANTLTLSLIFEIRFNKIAVLTGYFLLGVAIAGILCVPSARIWGKRHLFLLGTVIVIFSSVWGGASRSYSSLLASRIFQGLGAAPYEALVNAAVGDMYFVHERGKRMALTNLAVFGGAFFTPILVGKITHTIGWWWTFYFVAIFTGVVFPILFFFVPETAYWRSNHLNTDLTSSEDLRPPGKPQEPSNDMVNGNKGERSAAAERAPSDREKNVGQTFPNTHTFAGADTPLKTFTQRLHLFDGRKTDDSFFKLFLRPFALFAHPAILWACLIQGTMIGWTVFVGVALSSFFIGPPYFWDEVNTGYAYTGAFLGSVIGFLVAAGLADWSAKYMTRKNNGIYEPEFRIILVIPQLIFGCAGLYLFGVVCENPVHYHWVVSVTAFGLQVGGMVIGAVAASLYIVDAHRDLAIEAFTCILIFKNIFSFGLTFSAYDWIVKAGAFKVFMWISSVQVVVCLLAIPMYIFGKRNRSFMHKHDILKLTGLY